MIDIGTNGELVLGDCHRRLACSTAAGPALEGAKITCGMRAADGAVDRVWLEGETLRWHVIGDGPAQGIANVMLEASICERLVDVDTDEAKQSLQTLRRHLKECLSDVRQIIFDLRPMALDDLGLVAAVDQLVHQLHERGLLTVTLTLEGVEVPLEAHVKAALFRIVQEALNNVVHHANVSRASLRMLYTDVAVSILIEDKGEGFDEVEDLNEAVQKWERESVALTSSINALLGMLKDQ